MRQAAPSLISPANVVAPAPQVVAIAPGVSTPADGCTQQLAPAFTFGSLNSLHGGADGGLGSSPDCDCAGGGGSRLGHPASSTNPNSVNPPATSARITTSSPCQP